jgi:hypothetical protein
MLLSHPHTLLLPHHQLLLLLLLLLCSSVQTSCTLLPFFL